MGTQTPVLTSENVDPYPQLAVIDDGLFIVLLDIVREVVDGDIIVLNILHDLCQNELSLHFRFYRPVNSRAS
jgi:hypothetical protein